MNIRGEQGGIGAGQGGGRRKTLKTRIFRTDRCRAGERKEKTEAWLYTTRLTTTET